MHVRTQTYKTAGCESSRLGRSRRRRRRRDGSNKVAYTFTTFLHMWANPRCYTHTKLSLISNRPVSSKFVHTCLKMEIYKSAFAHLFYMLIDANKSAAHARWRLRVCKFHSSPFQRPSVSQSTILSLSFGQWPRQLANKTRYRNGVNISKTFSDFESLSFWKCKPEIKIFLLTKLPVAKNDSVWQWKIANKVIIESSCVCVCVCFVCIANCQMRAAREEKNRVLNCQNEKKIVKNRFLRSPHLLIDVVICCERLPNFSHTKTVANEL